MRHLIYKHAFFLLMAAILLAVIVNGQSDKPAFPRFEISSKSVTTIPIDTPRKANAVHFRLSSEAWYGNNNKILAKRDSAGRWAISDTMETIELLHQCLKKAQKMLDECIRVQPPKVIQEGIAKASFTDTPKKAPLIIHLNVSARQFKPSYSAYYSAELFYITDSIGVAAERDSAGNWIIIDAKRALESFYRVFVKEKVDSLKIKLKAF